MCLGIPGTIVEIDGEHPDLAKVDVSGVRRMINIGLLENEILEPGDWILIHVGFALSKIDEEEAASAMAFLEGIGTAYEEELAALASSEIEAGFIQAGADIEARWAAEERLGVGQGPHAPEEPGAGSRRAGRAV